MKVEVVPSFTDDDQNNLKILLETFGSAVSLEDIASSYCKTGRNLNSTAELLCNMPACSISGDPQNTDGASSGSSSSSSTSLLGKSHIVKLNKKKCSASIGTVSNLIGKDYVNPRPQSKGFDEKSKPVKLNSNETPVTEIWGEEKESGLSSQVQPVDNDLVEFLYKMLGDGFQLGMGVIQQVIGQCGYNNMPMIIDKLCDISAATLEKSDDVIGITAVNNIHDVGSTSCPKQSQLLHYSGSDASGGDESILPRTEMKRKDMQKEVLEALFSAPDRIQDHHESTHPVKTCRQSRYGQTVAKPLEDIIIEDYTFITRQPINDRNNEANEESFDELEKAWKENLVTMREYYKASADAFIKKELETAQSLQEQGDFYKMKAREAKEKSAQKLIKNSNEDEEFSINVHYLEPKDALFQLKLHLTSLCGFSSVRFMKVVVGTSGDKKDERRKRRITKLLKEEHIPWTEEGNGWIILVQVDEIDPNKLSFGKK